LGLGRLALGAVDDLIIYNGEVSVPPSISLGNWGTAGQDGSRKPSDLLAVTVSRHAIPVTTQGRYQGLRIDCTAPVDISPLLSARDTLLELYLGPAQVMTQAVTRKLPALGSLRVTLFTEHGIGTLVIPDEQLYPAELIDGAWYRIDLPLLPLSSVAALGGKLSRVVITAEHPCAFALGRLAFVRDDAPLSGQIFVFPAHPSAGKVVIFAADITSGATRCAVSWHFDSAAGEGTRVDATGDHATYQYAHPGTYTVICAIRDPRGVKAPVTLTKDITVNAP
jgi:hypothetical protein